MSSQPFLLHTSMQLMSRYLAEQYFSNQYSLQQRSVMLTALAMAARELAGLHVPEPAPFTRRIDFPSKTLPLALHRQYISPADQTPQLSNRPMNQIDMVSDDIRNLLLSKGAKRAEEVVPDIARQKRLRVGPTKSHAIAEEGSLASRQMGEAAQRALQAQAPKPVVPFREVAAEYFILPLVNLFWQHYQDTAAREARALASGSNYRGAGAGMILSPIALERFLLTLGLLAHAARHASVFLSVVVPETLELAVTIGSKHFSRPDDYMIAAEDAQHDGSKAEAQVVSAALELALVCLDGAVEVDQGRTLAMDKPELVLAAGEWAQGVFDTESRGGKVAQGQAREGKIRAAAAGVVIKVADIAEKWNRVGAIMRQ
jgi:telomere length regulation protein